MKSPAPAPWQRVSTLPEIFFLDPRGLALLRIGLGALVILRVLYLLPYAGLLLGPDGVLPLRMLSHAGYGSSLWMPYAWPTQPWQTVALMILHLAAAAALLLGWHSRIAAAATWLLTLSIVARNPLAMNHGDKLLVLLLFAALFLPLGRYLSLDARGKKDFPLTSAARWWSGFGSTFLILQLVLIYFISGFHKSAPAWGIDYEAVRIALMDASHATALGQFLTQFPLLLKATTFATIYLEQIFILLLLSPFYNQAFRLALAILFVGLHIGIILTMDLVLFPWVCLVAWAAILPAPVYDTLWRHVPAAKAAPANITPTWQPTVLAIAFMALLVATTIQPSERGTWRHSLATVSRTLLLNQRWIMYSPLPIPETRWFALYALDDAGRKMPLYPQAGTSFETTAPALRCDSYPSIDFRKFFLNLAERNDPLLYQATCEAFARYRSPNTADRFEIELWTRPNYPTPASEFTSRILYSSPPAPLHNTP